MNQDYCHINIRFIIIIKSNRNKNTHNPFFADNKYPCQHVHGTSLIVTVAGYHVYSLGQLLKTGFAAAQSDLILQIVLMQLIRFYVTQLNGVNFISTHFDT